jgi:hypothetical protein
MLAWGIAVFSVQNNPFELAFLIGFSTLFVYNILRVIKFILNPSSEQAILHKPFKLIYYVFASIGLLGVVINLFFYSFSSQWITELMEYRILLFISALLSLLYVLPCFSINGVKLALRDFPFLKILLISFVWSILCFYIPSIQSGKENTFLFLGFIYILAMTIPFDIRDLPFDHERQRTIPQLIGWHKAKKLSISILLLFFILLIIFFPNFKETITFWIVVTVHLTILFYVHPKRSHIFYGLFIDGTISLLGLMFGFATLILK